MNPTTNIEFTLDMLRVLAKSLGKTRDAELRKLARLKPGTHVHTEVKADFEIVDEVDAAVAHAISVLVEAS